MRIRQMAVHNIESHRTNEIREFGVAKAYFGLGEGGIGGSYVSMECLTVTD